MSYESCNKPAENASWFSRATKFTTAQFTASVVTRSTVNFMNEIPPTSFSLPCWKILPERPRCDNYGFRSASLPLYMYRHFQFKNNK